VRKRHPGTGVVILSQYEDPEYAVSLLAEGMAGYGYLLKDRVAEGNQLADTIRAGATGGTAPDPAIVQAPVRPVVPPGGLLPSEEELLSLIAEGKPIKAAAAMHEQQEAISARWASDGLPAFGLGLGLLPPGQSDRFRRIWDEFCERVSPAAKLARAMDRLQPMLVNMVTGGGTWLAHGVTADQALIRVALIADGSPALGRFARDMISRAVARGLLAPGRARRTRPSPAGQPAWSGGACWRCRRSAGCSTSASTRLAMNLAVRTATPPRVSSVTSTRPRRLTTSTRRPARVAATS
jgi:hypothetical protein